jgi:UDP-GlcNAc:undecaprenyl-phosphate GlcNAc-1-phosphate transferase
VAGLLVAHQLPLLSQISLTPNEPRAVIVAGGMICLLGVIDDRWTLDPLTKAAGQILAASSMSLLGILLSFAILPNGHQLSLGPETSVPLTVFITVLLVNAVNFVDGLDGLAAGIVAIAASAMFIYSYELAVQHGVLRAAPAALIAAVTVGACVGFLPHNFAPARLFMGDSGSMLLGLLLSASLTSGTGQVSLAGGVAAQAAIPLMIPLLLPFAVLAIPFVDLILAVIRRTRAGRSPFAPDKQHLHHRLLEIGHTPTRAVLLMYYWASLLAFGTVGLSMTSATGPVLAAMLLSGVSALVLTRRPRIGTGPPPAGPTSGSLS